jgi:hypothetical protein
MPDSEELRTEWCEGADKTVTVKTEGRRSDGGDDEQSFLQRRSSL